MFFWGGFLEYAEVTVPFLRKESMFKVLMLHNLSSSLEFLRSNSGKILTESQTVFLEPDQFFLAHAYLPTILKQS